MLKDRKGKFVNIYLNRFLEQAMDNIPTEQLPFLDSKDRENIVKKRSFLTKSTLEQKLLMLAKLGHAYAIVVVDQKKEWSFKKLWQLFRIFFGKFFFNKSKAVKGLKEAGVFVMSDIDVVRSMMLAANIYHSPMYNILNPYTSITENIFKYQNDSKMLAREISAAGEVDELILRGVRVGMAPGVQAEFLKLYKINHRELLILMYLSKKRQAKLIDIEKATVGRKSSNELANLQIKKMVHARRIKNPEGTGEYNEYWISGYGETVLIESRKYFIKHITG